MRFSSTLCGVDVTSDQLLTIDRTTGAATSVGPLGFGAVSDIAFAPSTVPEPTVLSLLGVGIVGLGLAQRRRRSRSRA